VRVVYYPQSFDGPGCYRCLYPGAQLAAHGGHEAKVGDHLVVEETEKHQVLRFNLDLKLEADLVVLHLPGDPGYQTFQKALQERGIKVVIDMDDDYLNLPNYNPASNGFNKYNRETMTWCLRHADAVTVTTPALKRTLTGVTRAPVYVLRNYLDWKVWKHVPPVFEQHDWDEFRVGYLGSATWHSGDLQVLSSPLRRWMEAHPEAKFIAAKDSPVHDILGVPTSQRVYMDSFAFRHQGVARYAATMDVGVVPLVKNRFNEAKSHLKGMEYAGVGVPCLATPTESYRDWWLAGDGAEAGYLCSGSRAWIHALDRLYEDREHLRAMGQKARELAARNTYQDHWRLWEATYNEILVGGSRQSVRPPDPVGATAAS
jgi:glycosyltransferase involved in cell wall biosynthesis